MAQDEGPAYRWSFGSLAPQVDLNAIRFPSLTEGKFGPAPTPFGALGIDPAVIDALRSVPFDYGRQSDNAGPLATVGPLSQAQTDYARALINTPRIPGQTGGPSLSPIEPTMQSYAPSFAEALKGGIQDSLMATGMDKYAGRHLGDAATNLGSLFPGVGIPMAADELYRAAENRDLFGGALASVGMLPMAKGAATAAKGVASEVAPGIRAYHGSPHDFDRFSLDKIGTGEGAQAYGHGLYFAGNEGVAKSYRDTLTARSPSATDAQNTAAYYLRGGSREQGIADLDKLAQSEAEFSPSQAKIYRDTADLLRSGWNPPKGHIYEVNLRADPEHFLDWDKPLSEQSQHVQQALKQRFGITEGDAGERVYKRLTEKAKGLDELRQEIDGLLARNRTPAEEARLNDLSSQLTQRRGPETATEMLRDAGIPGIKYLDQGSRRIPDAGIDAEIAKIQASMRRGQEGAAVDDHGMVPATLKAGQAAIADLEAMRGQTATRNYVAFDDRMIDIIRKYGIAGLIGGGAAATAIGSNFGSLDGRPVQ